MATLSRSEGEKENGFSSEYVYESESLAKSASHRTDNTKLMSHVGMRSAGAGCVRLKLFIN